MLINHRKKAIFVHNPGTGGASIAAILKENGFKKFGKAHDFYYEGYDDYFKFVFVRDPYEYAITKHRHITRKFKSYFSVKRTPGECGDYGILRRKGFLFFVTHFLDRWYHQKLYTLYVDYIARYENYDKCFKHICKRINIPYEKPTKIRHFSGEYKNSDYLTKEVIAVINKKYEDDFIALGYKMRTE